MEEGTGVFFLFVLGAQFKFLWDGRREDSQQSGRWCVEARLVQEEVDWLMQSHLVPEQQMFLLLETLPVLTAICSHSGQLEWR